MHYNRTTRPRAGDIIDRAILEDSSYELAHLLKQVLDRGLISDWASVKETAWSARPTVKG